MYRIKPKLFQDYNLENSPSYNEDLDFCDLLPQSPVTDYNILESAFENKLYFLVLSPLSLKRLESKKGKIFIFRSGTCCVQFRF